MLPNTVECRRVNSATEIRTIDGERCFVGRAVEYDQWSELLHGHFRERLAPGAFDDSLAAERDVYASVDHDMAKLLGRMTAGTLELSPDNRGIGVRVPIGDYTYAKDVETAIRRGDMRGMSFIFDVLDDKWESRDGVPHRTVTKADLYEVAFVFFPAYEQTSAGLRAVHLEGEKRARQRAYLTLHAGRIDLLRARLALAERE
jgi:HK97 family phage prohead protease